MSNRVDHITILGGGSAGWLAAAMLAALLNRRNDGPDIRLTLIESPRIPRIGVGEATTLNIRNTLVELNIDEKHFLKHTNGSFKCGVKFADWDRDASGRLTSFFHPFFAPGAIEGRSPAYHYLRMAKEAAAPQSIHRLLTPGTPLLEDCKAPRRLEDKDYNGFIRYAYHLDAALFADYLKDFAIAMGVEFIPDDVVDVKLDERGFVAALSLRERGAMPVEFVLDCSGFQGLVIRKALKEPFLSFSDHLLCDRAIPLQLDYPAAERGRLESFTTSTAISDGWVWKVPLYSRRGMGYVFSSKFTSDDRAIAQFMDYLGLDQAPDDIRIIPMQIGRVRRNWVNNCVAIGLSGGFVEPLEATALHFMQSAVRRFVDHFPDRRVSPELADAYNRITEGLYNEVRDIIALHYHCSTRDDTPFWKAVRHEVPVPDSLARRLALWKRKLPGPHDHAAPFTVFNEWSYIYILTGKGFFNDVEFPLESTVSEADFRQFVRVIERQQAELARLAPDHYALLTEMRAQEHAPWYAPAA